MSIQFGILRHDSEWVEEKQLQGLAEATKRFAPDGCSFKAGLKLGMGFQLYKTHKRSELEVQPRSDLNENRLTFDGRLDNHRELRAQLDLPVESSDSHIVLASFSRWGESCFSRLVGDWALALWSADERALYLARDHAGTRSLYFEQSKDCLTWSTFLETFFANRTPRRLNEAYVANYLGCRPLRGLTPYAGILMVPAAHYVKFRDQTMVYVPHWPWMTHQTIHYRNDSEYEEHFFELFRQSVERRTGEEGLILAQLSGGMDSSSIVCMSDRIRTRGHNGQTELLDTISFYDPREPELDEMPFVEAVEEQRGRKGIHVESSHAERSFQPLNTSEVQYLLPGADSSSLARECRLQEKIGSHKYRVMLSGTGGDEVMGGVSTPLPELGDYLVSGSVAELLRKGIEWCLPKRQPLVLMLRDTAEYILRTYAQQKAPWGSVPAWVNRDHLDRHPSRTGGGVFGYGPSRIENGRVWWAVQETLPHLYPSFLKRYEYRYPFLDRDLIDFLFRIPREQILRPGQKRSLQRRSLKTLLPEAVFNRSRKAYASRGISLSLRSAEGNLQSLTSSSVAVQKGIVDPATYVRAFQDYARGISGTNAVGLMRLLHFEIWLLSSLSNGYVTLS